MRGSRYYVFDERWVAPTLVSVATRDLKETPMKSLAYVLSAFLILAVAAPSISSARGWHHHHHHFFHHHH
jgi:hypothetical protein